MNIKDRLELSKRNIEWAQKQVAWYEKHMPLIAELGDIDVQYYMVNNVDFNYCTRTQTLAILQKFPGKWMKSVHEDRMDYTLVDPTKKYLDCTTLRIFGGTPPPSCRIVEETKVVPAHMVPEETTTIRRIVCDGTD